MHRVLLITEILHLVCQAIRNSYGQRTRLARLARTCLKFREPALDALWYDLDSLLPLIQCMPTDLWRLQPYKGMLSFQRPIAPTDWPRFTIHAQRVHRFTLRNAANITTTEFHMLSIAAGAQTLLPKLKQLTWTNDNDDIFPFIHLFLQPQIEHLTMSIAGTSFVRMSFLATLDQRYPALSLLHLTEKKDLDQSVGAMGSFSVAVCGWSRLRHLSVKCLHADALCHVATLPLLVRLRLEYVQNYSISELPPFQGVHRFPCLEELTVISKDITICTALVKMMTSSPTLISISFLINCFSTSPPPTPSQWDVLWGAMDDHCHHSSLACIQIDTLGGESVFQSHSLKPLYAFNELVLLKLSLGGRFDLDDTDVKEMALAWPYIQDLTLYGHDTTGVPRVTISGLLPFAQHCLDLERLSMMFDSRSVLPPTSDPQRFRSEALKILHVQDSPIDKPEWVAAFLSDIFPNLSGISTSDSVMMSGWLPPPRTEAEKMWARVENLVSAFALVRAQERKLCAAEKIKIIDLVPTVTVTKYSSP